ncbi:putative baseplate assembly protein [Rhodopila sp.]|uniref:putative baseplate assembly protein n=1 Tax=Rhodopila sp. TaxID=2480087 RepID=UPI002CADC678|nr:putative baseplate assembly protein [Rhodopila sp.]HVZ08879.1 putative baseplate assembly protein [Rhodopila sp.]
MPLPIPNLDDRRFDDLVAEATARVEAHTPEWSNIAPGDPGSALIDMFAWLAETILYRQNLIPLRQRRAFMNLLSLPLRPAAPATGVVCVDAGALPLPRPLAAGQAEFKVDAVTFTSTTDLQPTPLQLVPMMKARYQADAQTLSLLRTLYNYDQPVPFVAQPAAGADGAVHLADAADGQVWLALVTPKGFAGTPAQLRSALAGLAANGTALSVGLAPVADVPGYSAFDQATSLPARTLQWTVVTQDQTGAVRQVPLQVQADTSMGGRTAGVALLRLPSSADLLAPPAAINGGDPMFAGTVGMPPELPVGVTPDRVVMWLTLACADAPDLTLGYLAINAVSIIARAVEHNEPLGTATGAGDATFTLSGTPVDPASLTIQVWQGSQAATWTQVDNFGRAGRNDTVYVLDPAAGTVTFGDGISGLRPPAGAVIVAQSYAHGGGSDGNLAAGSIRAVQPSVGTVRHEWPTSGGSDGETVEQAERRIPAFLSNRDRAVTLEDFQQLAFDTPGVTLGRAEVVPGLMPGATAELTRQNVPGVVSVFVFPDQPVAFGNGPVATLAQLQDVFAWLRQRILIGTQLFVLSAEPVPVYASVSVRLLNGADAVATTQAVQQALAQYLWPLPPGGPDQGGWPLGRSVVPDELLTQAARQPGVLAADAVLLYAQSDGAWVTASSISLSPWQVPALQGVGVSTDGSAPPLPLATTGQSDATSGQTLVPIVPKLC